MVVCVAGPMAAGKNAAASMLEKKGFVSIDADVVAHEAIDECRERIIQSFSGKAVEKGITLTDENGKIIRKNLGKLIFSDKALVKMQEDIVYPFITEKIEKFIASNEGKNIIVNATLLYKVCIIEKIDVIVYIDSPAFLRFFRARKRDGLSCSQILARFHAQKNLYAKYAETGKRILKIENFLSIRHLEKKLESIGKLQDNFWSFS